MKTSWFIGLIMLFVVFSVISGIMEMSYFGGGEASRIHTLLTGVQIPEGVNFIGATIAFITQTWEFIANLWHMFWFDYAFFQGTWGIVRYIVFLPISIGLIVTLVLSVVRGVSST